MRLRPEARPPRSCAVTVVRDVKPSLKCCDRVRPHCWAPDRVMRIRQANEYRTTQATFPTEADNIDGPSSSEGTGLNNGSRYVDRDCQPVDIGVRQRRRPQ